jgi:hypothetical protein
MGVPLASLTTQRLGWARGQTPLSEGAEKLYFGTHSARPMTARHFPPPWSVEDNGACFIVRDHAGQALAYVYYEEEPGRRNAAGLLTM